MNEIIAAANTNKHSYARMKEDNTSYIAWQAKAQDIPPMGKVELIITWYCRNQKKDPDNIMAGQKFIMDGLKEAGVLVNDGWKQIKGITHRFEVDRLSPRVEVELREVA